MLGTLLLMLDTILYCMKISRSRSKNREIKMPRNTIFSVNCEIKYRGKSVFLHCKNTKKSCLDNKAAGLVFLAPRNFYAA